MSDIKKIVGINLFIMLMYMLLINITSLGQERTLAVLVLSALAVGIHVFISVLLSVIYFSKKDNSKGKSFLLSAGIVLVIGFSSCLGSSAI
jgi:hypothetical protein